MTFDILKDELTQGIEDPLKLIYIEMINIYEKMGLSVEEALEKFSETIKPIFKN